MKVLALQRESHVAIGVPSLSVAARITEVLDYMGSYDDVEYTSISESDESAWSGVKWADVLILSKHSSRYALDLVDWAKASDTRIIYDIDDWIFSFPEYSAGQLHNDRIDLIHELIGLADVVTVANKTLLNKVSAVISNLSPVLVPNGMWVEKYVAKGQVNRTEDVPPRIVFTNADLLKLHSSKDMLLTALQVFFMRHPDYSLDFYGDPFPEMFSLPFLHFTNRLPYEDYMKALVAGRYRFAITPLGGSEDRDAEEFNACKSPFKYLNYGTALVPGIYSRSLIYEDHIVHGLTGLLAKNDHLLWLDSLERLASDEELRRRIRWSAFDDINQHHHIKASAISMRKIFDDLSGFTRSKVVCQ